MTAKGPIDPPKVTLGSPTLPTGKIDLSFRGALLLEGIIAIRMQYSLPQVRGRIPIVYICDRLFPNLPSETRETIISNLRSNLGADHIPEAYLFDLTQRIEWGAQYGYDDVISRLVEIGRHRSNAGISEESAVPVFTPPDFPIKIIPVPGQIPGFPDNLIELRISNVCNILFPNLTGQAKEKVISDLRTGLGADRIPASYLLDLIPRLDLGVRYKSDEVIAKLVEIGQYRAGAAMEMPAVAADLVVRLAPVLGTIPVNPDNPIELRISEDTINALRIVKLLLNFGKINNIDHEEINTFITTISPIEKFFIADRLHLTPNKFEAALNHLKLLNQYFKEIWSVIDSAASLSQGRLQIEDFIKFLKRFFDAGSNIRLSDLAKSLSQGVIECRKYLLRSSRQEIDVNLTVYDLFYLGQARDLLQATKFIEEKDWETFTALYLNRPSFRETIIYKYVMPLESALPQREAKTGAIEVVDRQKLLQMAKIYAESFAKLDKVKKEPDIRKVAVIQELFSYPGKEVRSTIELALADQGREMIDPLISHIEGTPFDENRVKNVIKIMVEKENVPADLLQAIKDEREISFRPVTEELFDTIASENKDGKKYQMALKIFKDEPIGTAVFLSSGFDRNFIEEIAQRSVPGLFAALLEAKDPSFALVLIILGLLIKEAKKDASGEKTVLRDNKIVEGAINFMERNSGSSRVVRLLFDEFKARLDMQEDKILRVPNPIRQIHNHLILTQALLVLNIRVHLEPGSEDLSELVRYTAAHELRTPDIAYIPAFVMARIGAEHREKAADEIKRVLTERGRRGIYLAMDVVQNILGPDIYLALGKAYKATGQLELYPEILIYGNIIKETSRRDKVGTILEVLKNNQMLWKNLVDLLEREKFEDVRQIISIILEQARESSRENPFTKDNLEAAVSTAHPIYNEIIGNLLNKPS